jgi:hypothetical protein
MPPSAWSMVCPNVSRPVTQYGSPSSARSPETRTTGIRGDRQRGTSSMDKEMKRSSSSNSAVHAPPSGSVAMIDVSVSR